MDYYSSPRWTAEIADCSMPMTMDTYSNCSYKCIYCFSQFQRGIGEGKEAYLNNEVKWVNPEKFKEIWLHPEKSQFGDYIKAKRTMQWGGLSDQFDENERKYGKTLEMLRWLREHAPDQQISFSTKATWWLDDPRYTLAKNLTPFIFFANSESSPRLTVLRSMISLTAASERPSFA